MSVPPHFDVNATCTEVARKAPVATPHLRAVLDLWPAEKERARQCVIDAIHAMNGQPALRRQQERLSTLALQMQREADKQWVEVAR